MMSKESDVARWSSSVGGSCPIRALRQQNLPYSSLAVVSIGGAANWLIVSVEDCLTSELLLILPAERGSALMDKRMPRNQRIDVLTAV
jgi:hypothetical protein